VAKRKGEKYQLIWKDRTGFARMALRNRCTIIPFAAVGAEDAYDVVADANDLMASPLGPLLRRLKVRTDAIPPLVRGVGPTPLPRPERFYFVFRPPIPTGNYADLPDEDVAARDLRDVVHTSVAAGIAELLAHQAADPKRSLRARLR
jgi:1-acyl-sn-glycerol-3-phosphate acyltransferase